MENKLEENNLKEILNIKYLIDKGSNTNIKNE